MFCRDHVAQLRDHESEITAAGASLAVVGTGDIDAARRFKRAQGIGFPLLVDEELRSYGIVGARTGKARQLASSRTVTTSLKAMARGRFQGKVGNEPMLLGASHVIRPDGSVPFAWRNDDFTDDAPVTDLVAALRA